MIALSIRQPWAWLIVNGHKDVENRTWSTTRRGAVLIHASQGMTHHEYTECQQFVRSVAGSGIVLPSMADLKRGGIVGSVHVVDCVPLSRATSRWHVGPWGHVLANATPLPFVPGKGSLGYFEFADAGSPAQGALL